MSALGLLRWLVPALAGLALALLSGLAFDLVQRRRAAARVAALSPAAPSARAPFKELLQALHEGIEKRLPKAVEPRLRALLAAPAARGQRPGDFVLRSATYGLAGLALGLWMGSPFLALGLGLLALLPLIRLRDAADRRIQDMRRALPDSLDLLTACVQAGLGLDQALLRVTGQSPPGPLRLEWERTLSELRTGAPRRQAFAALEARAGLPELGPFLRAVLRSEARGVPLAPVLQAQSAQMRRLRSLRVQRQASQAPVKMLFPLMAFFLPAVFLVVFGPIILKLSELGF